MEEENLSNIEAQPEIPENIPQFRGFFVVVKDLTGRFFHNEKFKYTCKITFAIIATLLSLIALVAFILYFVPYMREKQPSREFVVNTDQELRKNPVYKKEISLLNKDIQRLSRKYNSYTSGQSYIVINTIENRFFLYRNKQLLRTGFCSSGSYTMLKTAEGDRKWIFKTPKGKYRIQGKTTHPVWRKPDWAFVEEGLPIPSATDQSRYEYGVLGDYAMAIGDGYLIHGTIYKRFLGMPVTHGCVRLNDEDLEFIFNTLSVGSKVYIF
ncbi:MAG TPA: L,D-transpeptidase [Bacteroidales bacterium]|nr:L,D-transpeptidase [Bacteroidales bacterium]